MKVFAWKTAAVMIATAFVASVAEAREWKTVEVDKYGYSFKIPVEFEVSGEIDKTTSWMYQPGSAPAASNDSSSKSKKKKRGFGVNIRGVGFRTEETTEESSSGGSSSSGGGLEPALQVYVNWVWMPDVAPGTLYSANIDSTKQNASSPDPDYHDIQVFDKKQGYAHEGNTYWYKEVDKKAGDEIHRWHIYSAGNKSAYTIGLTGTYEQFQEWGPVFEEVVKSFKLIPLKS